MAFFYSDTEAGAGIPKNLPPQSEPRRFFDIFGRKFTQIIALNFVYVLLCIPVVTAGAATVALAHVMRKFSIEQPIFAFDEFFRAFRKNFWRGLAIGITDIVFIILFYFQISLYISVSFMTPMAVAAIALMIFFAVTHFYIFTEIAALDLSMSGVLKNAVMLTVLGIKRNIITAAVTAVIITAVILFLPVSLFFLPFFPFAQLAFFITFTSYPVIQKYIIEPYYRERGEENPEKTAVTTDAVFKDNGGEETTVKTNFQRKKIIK